ncbi:MAG: helix-turn-helix transcriptional regulator [Nitrospina sp.]|jgi:transcriptional regulator with XRE-family HTH domain|nr:helix-turn-helix transcriptional regulator [Nitrospina sp.]MBT5633936.1 helix-turn-helix transcriptional regulator [Nitrospina sp.]
MAKKISAIEKLIGSRITEIRISKGLTQSQLAERINVSNETISRLERGVSVPSLKTLEKMAGCLKMPLSSFFSFEHLPIKNPAFERELAKLIALMRKRNIKELSMVHAILKVVFKNIKI